MSKRRRQVAGTRGVQFKAGERLVATGPQILCPGPYSDEGQCLPGKKPRRRALFTAADLFAGAGGFSTGVKAAGGWSVFAINHNANAVSAHILNHPETTHCCESVYNYDPSQMVEVLEARTRRRVPDVILASPSCRVTSKARTRGAGVKGNRAMTTEDDALRATPGAVHRFMEKVIAEAFGHREPLPLVVVENVPEFTSWGFKPKGSKKPNGALYRQWKSWWNPETGYHPGVEHILQAADFGTAAERRRLFVIFTPLDRYPEPIRLDLSRVKPVLGVTSSGKPREGFDWRYSPRVPRKNQLGQYLARDFAKSRIAPKGKWILSSSVKLPPWRRVFKENLRKAKERTGGQPPEYWTWSYTDNTAPRFLQDPQRTLTAEMGGQLYVMHSKGGVHYHRSPHPEELGLWMGFPKGYVLPASATEAGKLVGNAVVPSVAEFILESMIELGVL